MPPKNPAQIRYREQQRAMSARYKQLKSVDRNLNYFDFVHSEEGREMCRQIAEKYRDTMPSTLKTQRVRSKRAADESGYSDVDDGAAGPSKPYRRKRVSFHYGQPNTRNDSFDALQNEIQELRDDVKLLTDQFEQGAEEYIDKVNNKLGKLTESVDGLQKKYTEMEVALAGIQGVISGLREREPLLHI